MSQYIEKLKYQNVSKRKLRILKKCLKNESEQKYVIHILKFESIKK